MGQFYWIICVNSKHMYAYKGSQRGIYTQKGKEDIKMDLKMMTLNIGVTQPTNHGVSIANQSWKRQGMRSYYCLGVGSTSDLILAQ